MTDPTKKSRVFISYAKEDKASALRLYDDLVQHGAEPWLDERDLLPGQDWQREISRAIKNSDHFIALLSKHSVNKRGYVQKELRQAMAVLDQMPAGGIFIIPARLDNTVPTHDKLGEVHWVDLFPSWEDGIGKIGLSMDILATSETTSQTVEVSVTPVGQGGQQMTLSFPAEAAEEIERLAGALNTSPASVILDHAVGLLRLYVDAEERGDSLYLERRLGERTELVNIVLPSTSGVVDPQ